MKKYFLSFLLLALVFSGCSLNRSSEMSEGEYNESTESAIIATGENGFVYMKYDEEGIMDVKKDAPYALFFHASWCPTCRGIENGILKEKENFPPDTVVIKVDYDTEEALKKQYGITVQATVVILDSHKNVVQKLVAPKVQDVIDGLASLSVEEPS